MTLEYLTDQKLENTTHGFFTRKGGASSGIYAGLNCGTGSSDQTEIVRTNRLRVAREMGTSIEGLLSVHQIHSAEVVTVKTPGWPAERPKADAMVTNQPGIALGILTADCAPVLFSDPDAHVVGAAHAGWGGALAGITDNTISAMVALGAKREKISAVIGPCISQKNYEVGPEFFERFYDESTNNAQYFINGLHDRMLFDLPRYLLDRLRQANIANASWVGHCTYADPARFYSFRRTTHAKEVDYGRQISVIRL